MGTAGGSPSSVADPMPARVAALAGRAGDRLPRNRGEIVRCVLDSLALAYRRHLRAAASLAHRTLEVVHVVGGGSHNDLLCQLTADALELPVLAGASEAAALGNVLVQAARSVLISLTSVRCVHWYDELTTCGDSSRDPPQAGMLLRTD